MRASQSPRALSLLLVAFSQFQSASAGPYPRDDLHDLGFSYLQDRSCVSYCGADNQYCCTDGQACFTNAANVAYCSAGTAVQTGGSGSYSVYTTTYTETDLVVMTSTGSSYYAAATGTGTGTGVTPICDTSKDETSCGPICCAADQVCAFAGQCTAVTSSWTYGAGPTSSYSAALRPTGTGSVSATTTMPFQTPATATSSIIGVSQSSGGGGGLSGGAIAGIVIGVLAGIILLILLCLCCIGVSAFDGLMSIFGLGKSKRRVTEVETVERYSRHGSRHSGVGGGGVAAAAAAGAALASHNSRKEHRRWFGMGPARPARVTEERKKKSGLGGWRTIGAGLIGLAVVLGLRRRHEKKEMRERSDISSSYYTDSYTGTSSSGSSDSRRDSRRDRDSRR